MTASPRISVLVGGRAAALPPLRPGNGLGHPLAADVREETGAAEKAPRTALAWHRDLHIVQLSWNLFYLVTGHLV